MFAVIVCEPSFSTHSESPFVAISDIVLLCVVEEIVVPVVTGLPATSEKTPAEKDMVIPFLLWWLRHRPRPRARSS